MNQDNIKVEKFKTGKLYVAKLDDDVVSLFFEYPNGDVTSAGSIRVPILMCSAGDISARIEGNRSLVFFNKVQPDKKIFEVTITGRCDQEANSNVLRRILHLFWGDVNVSGFHCKVLKLDLVKFM